MQNEQRYAIMSFAPLRSLLRKREITELQLARKIGEKVGVVRNIQLQPKTTTVEVILKICDALGCQPCDIMKLEEAFFIPAKENDPGE